MTEQPVNETQNQLLGKIRPLKVEASTITEVPEIEEAELVSSKSSSYDNSELEAALIDATVVLLREFGIRKSRAAVRDAVEMPHKIFGPSHAVSALSMLGFKASFGSMDHGGPVVFGCS